MTKTPKKAPKHVRKPAVDPVVTEIVRNQKPVAKIVTLETSGEEYEDVLRNFKSFSMGEEPKNAIQRVLLDMMNQAEGFLILTDPDNADNDAIFRDFLAKLTAKGYAIPPDRAGLVEAASPSLGRPRVRSRRQPSSWSPWRARPIARTR